jgi:hypothetical protein
MCSVFPFHLSSW